MRAASTSTARKSYSTDDFAYDSDGNFVSINTVLGFQDASGTRMDGTTAPLVAVTPIETDIDTGRVTVFLSIQDIGDSIYDSAVLVDNFRWLYGSNCERTVVTLTDSDGDSLPDEWETNGIDYDGDGSAEVDLVGLGASPHRADLFLEIDSMEKKPTCLLFLCWGARSFAPDRAALQDLVDAFAAAPYTNPNGTTGITVHVDAGIHSPGTPSAGGNSIPSTRPASEAAPQGRTTRQSSRPSSRRTSPRSAAMCSTTWSTPTATAGRTALGSHEASPPAI